MYHDIRIRYDLLGPEPKANTPEMLPRQVQNQRHELVCCALIASLQGCLESACLLGYLNQVTHNTPIPSGIYPDLPIIIVKPLSLFFPCSMTKISQKLDATLFSRFVCNIVNHQFQKFRQDFLVKSILSIIFDQPESCKASIKNCSRHAKTSY